MIGAPVGRAIDHARVVICAILCAVATPSVVIAQVPTAAVHGVVRDATEAVLQNATVTHLRLDTNPLHRRGTSPDGSFQFAALAPGRDSLSVGYEGFASVEREFELTIDQDLALPIAMAVAPLGQTLTVTSEPLIEASKT